MIDAKERYKFLQRKLEVSDPVNEGAPKTSAPIGTYAPMSDNKHSAPPSPSKGRPVVVAKLIPSIHRPGELSLRMPDEVLGSSWVRFFRALERAGFKAGDVVTIERAS